MYKGILFGIFILTFETHLSAGVWPGETWQTASPESQGVDSAKLNQAMSYLASKCGSHGTDQAVVIRNGYMIWKGSDIDNSHNVWSASEAFKRLVQAVTDTRVSIVNNRWHINGAVTYPGAKAEGLLMNVRMVNCTFEDLNRPDFDAEANTDEFITRIPDYMAHGVRAFTVKWIKACGFTNVVLKINNEYPHKGFDHRLLRTREGVAELIRLARRTAPDLFVSASGYGDGRLAEQVARASDFLLIHFNGTPLDAIPGRIAALKRFGKPIVCNKDVKVGAQGAKAAESCVANGASWGLMLERTNQHFPFTFNGAADDAVVYAKLKELTSP